jgi:hypothetical protein
MRRALRIVDSLEEYDAAIHLQTAIEEFLSSLPPGELAHAEAALQCRDESTLLARIPIIAPRVSTGASPPDAPKLPHSNALHHRLVLVASGPQTETENQ